ncbi:permease [Candidatus Fermentibacteria bacterium]|nr:permease [Candidatus Fermentibacteria bacterium]
MNANTWIMLGLFLALAGAIWLIHGGERLLDGLREGFDSLKHVWLLLFLALGIAGFLQVVIPHEVVARHIGPQSGLRGLLIGWGVGAVMPGAPYTVLPIAASLLRSGSGIGPVMTMVLSASIGVAVTRIPYEIAFVGWKFMVFRLFSCLAFPLVGGVAVRLLNQLLRFFPRG